MSDSDRPIDWLVASLLASTPDADGETKPGLVGGESQPGRAVEGGGTAHAAVETLSGRVSTSRLEGFCPALARFFDVEEASARQLLSQVDMPEEWMEGPDVGISVLPVAAGPEKVAALASLVKLPPGVTLSDHAHVGLEQLLVLEGGFADSQGNVVWPGEMLEMAAGTSHSMWGLPGPPCVCAALLWLDGGDGSG